MEPQCALTAIPTPPCVDSVEPPRRDSAVWHLSETLPPPLTNNRAEMTALIRFLTLLLADKSPIERGDTVIVFCDNKYTLNVATQWLEGWRKRNYHKADGKPVLNVDLVRRLDHVLQRAARAQRKIEWRWVRAHQSEPTHVGSDTEEWRNWFGNRHADWLANLACGVDLFTEQQEESAVARVVSAAAKKRPAATRDRLSTGSLPVMPPAKKAKKAPERMAQERATAATAAE